MGRVIQFFQAIWFVWKHGSDFVFRDPLTEVFSRRFLEIIWPREVGWAKRYNRQLTIAFLDIVDFKAINDMLGHLMGDKTLLEVAGVLSACCRREVDVLVRWGGDEFLFVLPETDEEGAEHLMDRISDALLPLKIRIRYGIATYAEGISLEELVAMADSKGPRIHT